MSSKPKKAFDGIARPQGFIDDAAKAASKLVKGAASRYQVMRGPLNRNVKDSIKGAAKKDNVVLNMYANQYNKPAKKAMSPKVQQQVARSMTKRRAMAKTESMAKKYYGK